MRLKRLPLYLLGLLTCYNGHALPAEAEATAYISIIIDDIGYNKKIAKQLISLPQDLTISILPYSPYAKKIAKLAHKHNKEIMLHLPMESDKQHKLHEPQTLMLNMKATHFKNTLHHNLQKIPYISGINNHMGSKLTSCFYSMDRLMTELAKTPLYFVDSRTTTLTIAADTATDHNIPALSRDIFLDNKREFKKIGQQLSKLKKLAKSKGYALAIGHPYPETFNAIEQFTKNLNKDNIVLIPVSQLIQIKTLFNHNALLAQQH